MLVASWEPSVGPDMQPFYLAGLPVTSHVGSERGRLKDKCLKNHRGGGGLYDLSLETSGDHVCHFLLVQRVTKA